MRTFAVAEFAALRRAAQDRAIEGLTPAVTDALSHYGRQDWWRPLLTPVHELFNEVLTDDSGGDVRTDVRGWARLADRIIPALSRTQEPGPATGRLLAIWLSTATINAAAQVAADHDPEALLLTWVTMHDDRVRAEHKATDGQERPPGEPYDVAGVKMAYPGDPVGPVELWINCRCMVRPMLAAHTMSAWEPSTFAATTDTHTKHRVVVALPEKDHPVHDIGQVEGGKHMTLLNLGTPQENPNLDLAAVKGEVAHHASHLPPFTANVNAVDQLGDEGANVWMCDASGAPVATRDHLLTNPILRQANEAVPQHPEFKPHVTIDYAAAPDEAAQVQGISFDRLGLWDGEDRTEFPLGGDMPEQTPAPQAASVELASPLAWHGVLAPEGVWSGDKRRFAPDSLRFRDLPLPLTWQKVSQEGHDGSMTVAKIEAIARVEGQMRATGTFLASPEADEVVGLIAEFGKFGVSVDADDSEYEFTEETGEVTFTSARIASASVVAIPAFAEAFVALGPAPADFMPADASDCDPSSPDYEQCMKDNADKAPAPAMATLATTFVSDTPWSNFTQADYTPAQWKTACVLHLSDAEDKSQHKLPIKEPGGALNRNGVHAAAGRFNQVAAPAAAKAAAKSALRGAYSTLGEEPPDVLKASEAEIAAFGRGPGWVTNPEDTKRLHDYWTVPGEEGYAKIGWGVAGDFNRCRVEVGQEIAEKDPAKAAKFLNQICAQWHHDATGFWPGRAPSEQVAALVPEGEMAPALTLVASVGTTYEASWFKDPHLAALTPLTVTAEGRVFGHLAGWKTCHAAYPDTCVAPPNNTSGYAHYLTGEVATTEGPMAVGRVTMGGGHAGHNLRPNAALAHYDSVSTVVALTACGEDEFGIWLAGTIAPGVDDGVVDLLRASPLSGDWRKMAGEYELIAALAVNAPGFLVPRVGISDGLQVSLVAAGVVSAPTPQVNVDWDAMATRVLAEIDAREARRQRLHALAGRTVSAD